MTSRGDSLALLAKRHASLLTPPCLLMDCAAYLPSPRDGMLCLTVVSSACHRTRSPRTSN